jgi:hypothetical protein
MRQETQRVPGPEANPQVREGGCFGFYCEMTISEVLLIEYVEVGRKGKINLN